jgi:protein TonB
MTALTGTELIAIVALVVVGVAAVATMLFLRKRRTKRRRSTFGGVEYARAVKDGGTRRQAEAGLDQGTELVLGKGARFGIGVPRASVSESRSSTQALPMAAGRNHTMRVIAGFGAMALGLAITVTGCASPPAADVDAARASVDAAVADHADQYAATSLKAAQDARAALDAELKAQEGKWFKSYDKTRELAVAAKAAGDKAAADAAAAKTAAEAVAIKEKADAAARAKAMRPPLRIGGHIKPPAKTKDVKPVYPAMAQAARVGGEVTIEATIGPDGKVADAKVVRSIPLLDQAALDAVRQWEYTPTLLNGVPVPVVMTVKINFTRQ